MTRPAERTAYDGYAAFAPLYDEFIAHPAYRQWVLAIESTARSLGSGGVRLLDLGCGTGRSFAPLLGRGYLVTACEPVGSMLAQARRRSPRRVRIAQALAADAPAGAYDLVLALNDVVNCIPDADELRRTLVTVAHRLAPEGVFAFDVTPPASHARAFTTRGERATARASFEWRPMPATEGHHVAHLHARPRRGPEAISVHRQRVVEEAELHAALAHAGLRVAAVRGCDNEGHLTAAGPEAFKNIYFTQLAHPRRRRKEGPDAEGAQAPEQGARHARDDQDRVTGFAGAAEPSVAPHAREVSHGR